MINKEENGFVDLELAGKVSRHAMTVPRNSVHVNAAPSAWNGWSIHRSNCRTANSLRFDYNNVTLHRDVRNNASNAHEEVETNCIPIKRPDPNICSFILFVCLSRAIVSRYRKNLSFDFLQSHFLQRNDKKDFFNLVKLTIRNYLLT